MHSTPPHAATSGGSKAPMAQSKQDDYIMNTNDSSIVSKRSVCRFYFPNEPDFYEPFVTKFHRRNPLINRGYWLRMHAIEQAVFRFLNEGHDGRAKAIVNLGCGYDPLPWQFWHRHASSCTDAMFVDVDYPPLMQRKRESIQRSPLLQSYLPGLDTKTESENVIARCGSKYAAVGCDLRDLTKLESILMSELGLEGRSIIFVAEVSITYMAFADADKLIGWASSLKNAQFSLLEQCLPCGPHHPFAKTMLAHFHKLQTPIHAVEKYPSLGQQQNRFKKLGWPAVHIETLWEYWSNLSIIPATERRHLDETEPFDEWEEFALFGGHYFILSARNSGVGCMNGQGAEKPSNTAVNLPVGATFSLKQPSIPIDPSMPLPQEATQVNRRFAASFRSPSGDIFVHGGLGPQQRLQSVDSYGSQDLSMRVWPTPTYAGRMCHTISYCGTSEKEQDQYLMVGGRASPRNVQADYIVSASGEQLSAAQDGAKHGRFRHCAVEVRASNGISKVQGVLVFGGKSASDEVLGDWRFWEAGHGWRDVAVTGTTVAARFGAAMAVTAVDECRGILLGGMDGCGNILGDLIEWELKLSASGAVEIVCNDRTKAIAEKVNVLARFGAKLLRWKNKMLLIGGIGPRRIVRMDHEILLVTVERDFIGLERVKVDGGSEQHPLLVGASAEVTTNDEILLLGGGAVCFSMGSFLNPPRLLLTEIKSGTADKRAVEGNALASSTPHAAEQQPRITKVPRVSIATGDDFDAIVAAGRPVVIENQSLGPCTDLWTPEYLEERIGSDYPVVVHVSSEDRMTFAQKNFQYTKQSFGEFIQSVKAGGKLYLRAASAKQPFKQPTKLDVDFPSISQDFQIPTAFERVRRNLHSSPLRISGPVSLWLHYDVLANVLCQIRGRKTLRLYPPWDVTKLGVGPGTSSSNLDVFKDAQTDPALAQTQPHDADLWPGDILYLPPMWLHGARPTEGVSVAVNVFFRDMAPECYAAGRDVYGNRDLQAYEDGRKTLDRMVKAFDAVPGDARQFYLLRLAAELQEKAGPAKENGDEESR